MFSLWLVKQSVHFNNLLDECFETRIFWLFLKLGKDVFPGRVFSCLPFVQGNILLPLLLLELDSSAFWRVGSAFLFYVLHRSDLLLKVFFSPSIDYQKQAISAREQLPCQTTLCLDLFILGHFQHSTGHIKMGSFVTRKNQYIQLVKILYCKVPTIDKQRFRVVRKLLNSYTDYCSSINVYICLSNSCTVL